MIFKNCDLNKDFLKSSFLNNVLKIMIQKNLYLKKSWLKKDYSKIKIKNNHDFKKIMIKKNI